MSEGVQTPGQERPKQKIYAVAANCGPDKVLWIWVNLDPNLLQAVSPSVVLSYTQMQHFPNFLSKHHPTPTLHDTTHVRLSLGMLPWNVCLNQ